MPFDYAVEAARYDATRGGEKRAEAVAAAVAELVPHPGTLLDVAAAPESSATGWRRADTMWRSAT